MSNSCLHLRVCEKSHQEVSCLWASGCNVADFIALVTLPGYKFCFLGSRLGWVIWVADRPRLAATTFATLVFATFAFALSRRYIHNTIIARRNNVARLAAASLLHCLHGVRLKTQALAKKGGGAHPITALPRRVTISSVALLLRCLHVARRKNLRHTRKLGKGWSPCRCKVPGDQKPCRRWRMPSCKMLRRAG